LPWLFPDTKAQVTIEFKEDSGRLFPVRINTVIVTMQHDQTVTLETLRRSIREYVLDVVLPPELVDNGTIYYVSSQIQCCIIL
jgi:S-adenosylmethionine synthetase